MNDSDNCQSCRVLLVAVLFSLLLLCAGLGLTYLRQAAQMKMQVVQSERVVQAYNTNVLPRINSFVKNLQLFSKSNPDFGPILTKYGLQPGASPAAAPKN